MKRVGLFVITLATGIVLVVGYRGATPAGCDEVMLTCDALVHDAALPELKKLDAKAKRGYGTIRVKALRCGEVAAKPLLASLEVDGGRIEIADEGGCDVETCPLGKCGKDFEVPPERCAMKPTVASVCARKDALQDGGVVLRDPGIGNAYRKQALTGAGCVDAPCARIFGRESE